MGANVCFSKQPHYPANGQHGRCSVQIGPATSGSGTCSAGALPVVVATRVTTGANLRKDQDQTTPGIMDFSNPGTKGVNRNINIAQRDIQAGPIAAASGNRL